MDSDIKHSSSTERPTSEADSNLSARYKNLLTRHNLLIEHRQLLNVHFRNVISSKGVKRRAYIRILFKAFSDFLEVFSGEFNHFEIVETSASISCDYLTLDMPTRELTMDGIKHKLTIAEARVLQRLLLAQGSVVIFTDRKFITDEVTSLRRKVPALKTYIKNANSHGMLKAYQIIF